MSRPVLRAASSTSIQGVSMRLTTSFGFALLSLLGPGCESRLGARTPLMEIEVALEGSSAMILSSAPTTRPNPPVVGAAAVQWLVRDEAGRVVARGEIEDARVVDFEDALEHREEGAHLLSPVGHFRIAVPRIEGEVELHDASGVVTTFPIGRSAARIAPLLDADADVLGPPTAAPGSAAGPTRILFVPEGFTEAEQARFHTLVADVLTALRAMPDFARSWDRFAFVEQEVRSRESGIDRPASTGSPASEVDTAFDVSLGIGGVYRCAFFESRSGRLAVERLRDEAGAALVVVLANLDEWSGCAGPGVTVNAAENAARLAQVVAHEMGHALFGLADEYSSESSSHGRGCGAISMPNVASDLRRLPWADLLTTTELPTADTAEHAASVGAFEGAGYCTTGRYRPSRSCMMRSAYNPLCPVCRREMDRRLGVAAPTSEPGAPPTEPSDVLRRITVRNRTGAGLWARCASASGPGCSDWTWIGSGSDASVESFDGRYTLDNQDMLPDSPIRSTFRADRELVEVVASSRAPLPSEDGGSCRDTCRWAHDGVCDDGGEGAAYSVCERGTDCADCGARSPMAAPVPDAARCDDSCSWAHDGVCDDGSQGGAAYCDLGTDCTDCHAASGPVTCDDSCTWAADGECDDGGPGSLNDACSLGTDCTDCGAR
jgi:hypothetical protein